MEDIIKIINIIVWPLATLIFLVIFIFIFRMPISVFIGRIKSVGKSGVTTDTPLEAQSAELREKAVEKLMKIDESPVRQEFEDCLLKDLSSRGLETKGDSIKVLIRILLLHNLHLNMNKFIPLYTVAK